MTVRASAPGLLFPVQTQQARTMAASQPAKGARPRSRHAGTASIQGRCISANVRACRLRGSAKRQHDARHKLQGIGTSLKQATRAVHAPGAACWGPTRAAALLACAAGAAVLSASCLPPSAACCASAAAPPLRHSYSACRKARRFAPACKQVRERERERERGSVCARTIRHRRARIARTAKCEMVRCAYTPDKALVCCGCFVLCLL